MAEFNRVVVGIAALSLATPIIVPTNQGLIFAAFILFEVCVGIFWPAMGTMRGRYVPETGKNYEAEKVSIKIQWFSNLTNLIQRSPFDHYELFPHTAQLNRGVAALSGHQPLTYIQILRCLSKHGYLFSKRAK